jgi:opacity protein-like surface antigen
MPYHLIITHNFKDDMRHLLFVAIFISYLTSVQAAPTKAQPVLQPLPVPKAQPSASTPDAVNFSMIFGARYSTQAEKQPDGTRAEYITYEFIPTLKTEDYRIRFISDFYYQVKDQSGNEWENTVFEATINKPWSLSHYVDLKPDLILALPLFKRSGDFKHFYGARMTAILNSKNADIPDLILKYGLQYGKFDFKQETKADGSYNIDSRLRQRVHLGYKFTDALTGMIYFHFDSNFLLDNTVRNTYFHETSLEYAFNDMFSANVGITNGGGLYKGEFQEQDNLNFYDKNTTEAFGGVIFNF